MFVLGACRMGLVTAGQRRYVLGINTINASVHKDLTANWRSVVQRHAREEYGGVRSIDCERGRLFQTVFEKPRRIVCLYIGTVVSWLA